MGLKTFLVLTLLSAAANGLSEGDAAETPCESGGQCSTSGDAPSSASTEDASSSSSPSPSSAPTGDDDESKGEAKPPGLPVELLQVLGRAGSVAATSEESSSPSLSSLGDALLRMLRGSNKSPDAPYRPPRAPEPSFTIPLPLVPFAARYLDAPWSSPANLSVKFRDLTSALAFSSGPTPSYAHGQQALSHVLFPSGRGGVALVLRLKPWDVHLFDVLSMLEEVQSLSDALDYGDVYPANFDALFNKRGSTAGPTAEWIVEWRQRHPHVRVEEHGAEGIRGRGAAASPSVSVVDCGALGPRVPPCDPTVLSGSTTPAALCFSAGMVPTDGPVEAAAAVPTGGAAPSRVVLRLGDLRHLSVSSSAKANSLQSWFQLRSVLAHHEEVAVLHVSPHQATSAQPLLDALAQVGTALFRLRGAVPTLIANHATDPDGSIALDHPERPLQWTFESPSSRSRLYVPGRIPPLPQQFTSLLSNTGEDLHSCMAGGGAAFVLYRKLQGQRAMKDTVSAALVDMLVFPVCVGMNPRDATVPIGPSPSPDVLAHQLARRLEDDPKFATVVTTSTADALAVWLAQASNPLVQELRDFGGLVGPATAASPAVLESRYHRAEGPTGSFVGDDGRLSATVVALVPGVDGLSASSLPVALEEPRCMSLLRAAAYAARRREGLSVEFLYGDSDPHPQAEAEFARWPATGPASVDNQKSETCPINIELRWIRTVQANTSVPGYMLQARTRALVEARTGAEVLDTLGQALDTLNFKLAAPEVHSSVVRWADLESMDSRWKIVHQDLRRRGTLRQAFLVYLLGPSEVCSATMRMRAHILPALDRVQFARGSVPLVAAVVTTSSVHQLPADVDWGSGEGLSPGQWLRRMADVVIDTTAIAAFPSAMLVEDAGVSIFDGQAVVSVEGIRQFLHAHGFVGVPSPTEPTSTTYRPLRNQWRRALERRVQPPS